MKLQALVFANLLVILAFFSIAIWLAYWHHFDRRPIFGIGMLALLVWANTGRVPKLKIRKSS